MKHAYVVMMVMAIWGHGALLGGCDKEQPLPSCSEETPCDVGECVEGYCQMCNPMGHAGCGAEEAVCQDKGSDGNALYVCEMCDNDAECAANANAEVGDYCVEGRCVDCRPAGELTGQAGCDAGAPRCLPEGVCGPCDEVTQDGCEGDKPVCDGGRCFECKPETEDEPQMGCGGATPICDEAGRCVSCDPLTQAGCGGATPVCDPANQICRACVLGEQCVDGLQCLGGQCVAEPASVVAALTAEPRFRVFRTIVQASDLAADLQNRGGINVFVPTNAAFGTLPDPNGCPTVLRESAAPRRAFIEHSIVPGGLLDLTTLANLGRADGGRALTTLLMGHPLLLVTDGETPSVDGIRVSGREIRAGNGRIFVLEDGVLIPDDHMSFVGSPCVDP